MQKNCLWVRDEPHLYGEVLVCRKPPGDVGEGNIKSIEPFSPETTVLRLVNVVFVRAQTEESEIDVS